MQTREITKEELGKAEVICYGFKAINYDSSTKAGNEFRYGKKGENLVGKIFTVDGEIQECKWGLHFSKDPAYVFNFYEPLGYNRYFKVAAYNSVIDDKEGMKSVAQTIEFVEEYDLMKYINLIKEFNRSSNAVSDSNAVSGSNAVSSSTAVSYSDAVNGSDAVSSSTAVSGSNAVRSSNAVRYSYGIRGCEAIKYGVFCYAIECKKYVLFNKKITKERYEEVYQNIRGFNFIPHFDNFYELKGSKEWWALCFPELCEVDNKTAWSKMPKEMLEYIKSLPEYDEEIFKKITED